MDDPVVTRLLEIVEYVAGAHRLPDDLGVHTPITAGGLELDSVAVLELILACETEFSVTFDPRTDLTREALHTIGSLARSVHRARGTGG
jgi:acyl carrier protein